MVYAEVPLWVVHPGTKIVDGAKSLDKTGHLTERAKKSLSLLQAGGGGKCAIYSVDVNPQGTRFATGGGDCTVRIWSVSSLFSKQGGEFGVEGDFQSSDSSDGPSEQETNQTEESSVDGQIEPVHDLSNVVRRKKDGSSPSKLTKRIESDKPALPDASPSKQRHASGHHHRLLSTLSAHTGSSVLAVRFSTNGQYLASAGDDAVVCIYAPSKSSAAAKGNLIESSIEHWSRIKLCRGHTLDVVGLAWAPDDSHLVSCSLDSDAPIIVWKLTDLASDSRITKDNVLCNPYKILGKGIHTSTVKGVTFDPAGTYLASSGDDPAVCVWRAHDDWGLERRVDAGSGIFRSWKQGEEDLRELSSQTLFRRLDWSTDGSYICSTNATVKNKHVASTISREGWSVSSPNSAAPGAANLVGHKQPVVVCRHSKKLLDARKEPDGDDDDDDPEYATLLALGDKRGFVTVWSTRKSRPIFKLQCSESRCTVTDLSWGKSGNDLILLVALLDGHLLSLRFAVPRELGPVLSDRDQGRVFQLKYGIDLDDEHAMGRRRLFVGDSSGPKLIENPLQMTLEEEDKQSSSDISENGGGMVEITENAASPMSPLSVKMNQLESRSKIAGKKRVRPVLMNVTDDNISSKKGKQNGSKADNLKKNDKAKKSSVDEALESAATAASAAEDMNATSEKRYGQKSLQTADTNVEADSTRVVTTHHRSATHAVAQLSEARIPHSTNKIHTVELPLLSKDAISTQLDNDKVATVADCVNSFKVPNGSSGQSIECATVTVSNGGRKLWQDELLGSSCSAIAASSNALALGTTDGAVYLFGTSPTLGWQTCTGFRSHPPLILGSAIVNIQLMEKGLGKDEESRLDMLVACSDGKFGVYSLIPECGLIFKGSMLPAMTHMTSTARNGAFQSKLARIQISESGHLLLILSLDLVGGRSSSDGSSSRNVSRGGGTHATLGVGGSLQAFVYNRSLELWMRVSDGRFVLSDFYSMLPTTKANGIYGPLARIDDVVRSGTTFSSLKPAPRGRHTSDGYTPALYQSANGASSHHDLATRSHCEDRMACALALNSSTEFEHWFHLFVRTLSMGGHERQLRLVVDLLLGSIYQANGEALPKSTDNPFWWLASATSVLGLSRKRMVEKFVIPEMSKNRALQRLTNEISLDLSSLTTSMATDGMCV